MKSRPAAVAESRTQIAFPGARRISARGISFRGAVRASIETLPMFLTLKPGTPLRGLAWVALTAAARSRGFVMTKDQHRATVATMEFGAVLNDYLDGDLHDRSVLKSHAKWLAASPHRDVIRLYVKRLIEFELNRPKIGASFESCRDYREEVNRLSLAVLWAVASNTSLAAAEVQIIDDGDLRLLFGIVMQAQIIDDALDFEADMRRRLPSLANAAGADRGALRSLTQLYGRPGEIPCGVSAFMRCLSGLASVAARFVVQAFVR